MGKALKRSRSLLTMVSRVLNGYFLESIRNAGANGLRSLKWWKKKRVGKWNLKYFI